MRSHDRTRLRLFPSKTGKMQGHFNVPGKLEYELAANPADSTTICALSPGKNRELLVLTSGILAGHTGTGPSPGAAPANRFVPILQHWPTALAKKKSEAGGPD